MTVAGLNFTLDRLGFNSTGDSGNPLVQLQGSVALPGGLNLAVNGTNTVNVTTSGFSLTGANASLSNNFTIGSTTFSATNLTGSYTASTNTFTLTGQSSATVSGLGNVVLNLGNSAVGSAGVVVTNGTLQRFDAGITGNLSVAGASFSTNNLILTENTTTNIFTISGGSNFTASGIGNVSVYFGGANSTGLVLTNGSLTSVNATLNSNLVVAGTTFSTTGLNILGNTSVNTFNLVGNSSVTLPNMGKISLVLGGSGLSGLVISNGSLSSLYATATANLTLAGGNFSSTGLSVNYVSASSNLAIYGNASFAFGSNNLSLVLGNSSSPGMVIANGAVSSFNSTFNGNLSVLNTNFTANSLNLTADSANNTFSVKGNASFSIPKLGNLSVIFGSANSAGLVSTNGSVTSVNMTVNSNLTVAGSTFQATGLNITGNTTTNAFTMKGNASLAMPSIGAVSIGFGCGSTSGLVVTNGVLTTLNATVTGNLSVGGVSFATNNLTFAYNSVNDSFSLTGGSNFTANGAGNLNVYFGGTGSSGLVIANGAMTSLNMTVTSNVAFAGVNFNTTNMIITGDTANSVYTLTGCTSASVTGIGNIAVQFGKKDSSNNVMSRGLVISNGSLSLLDMTVNSNIAVAGQTFSTTNLRLLYTPANTTTSVAAQFSMTGLTTATITSLGSISVGFGCSTTAGNATKGLVITGGSLTSLDMTVNTNITAGGLTFNANNLTFAYYSATNYFAMKGNSKVSVPSVGNLSVTFGNATSNGLVVTNGSLTSLDMTVNSNLNVGSLAITTRNLNFT